MGRAKNSVTMTEEKQSAQSNQCIAGTQHNPPCNETAKQRVPRRQGLGKRRSLISDSRNPPPQCIKGPRVPRTVLPGLEEHPVDIRREEGTTVS